MYYQMHTWDFLLRMLHVSFFNSQAFYNSYIYITYIYQALYTYWTASVYLLYNSLNCIMGSLMRFLKYTTFLVYNIHFSAYQLSYS